ncbi:hypothetical protein MIR68_000754 [Amoeboaphelidium protococcarum]|nr:hypothetical protein MIR68_000754 [Amoeboaphelidium protococcarum]
MFTSSRKDYRKCQSYKSKQAMESEMRQLINGLYDDRKAIPITSFLKQDIESNINPRNYLLNSLDIRVWQLPEGEIMDTGDQNECQIESGVESTQDRFVSALSHNDETLSVTAKFRSLYNSVAGSFGLYKAQSKQKRKTIFDVFNISTSGDLESDSQHMGSQRKSQVPHAIARHQNTISLWGSELSLINHQFGALIKIQQYQLTVPQFVVTLCKYVTITRVNGYVCSEFILLDNHQQHDINFVKTYFELNPMATVDNIQQMQNISPSLAMYTLFNWVGCISGGIVPVGCHFLLLTVVELYLTSYYGCQLRFNQKVALKYSLQTVNNSTSSVDSLISNQQLISQFDAYPKRSMPLVQRPMSLIINCIRSSIALIPQDQRDLLLYLIQWAREFVAISCSVSSNDVAGDASYLAMCCKLCDQLSSFIAKGMERQLRSSVQEYRRARTLSLRAYEPVPEALHTMEQCSSQALIKLWLFLTFIYLYD